MYVAAMTTCRGKWFYQSSVRVPRTFGEYCTYPCGKEQNSRRSRSDGYIAKLLPSKDIMLSYK